MICWIESVDPVADLCLANQIYSVLLMLLNLKKSLKCKMLTVARTRHHRARLLRYYPTPPCAPSFVKSRMLRPLQTHFLLFQQTFFILGYIHAGNPRAPRRVSASRPKPCGAIIVIPPNLEWQLKWKLLFLYQK